ncbi:MAG: MFS transporter [Christensenellaceae bacterium]|jgi:Na+/melibiose symporter-like transporter|nr:MFS transporter [Christensenellaceae bacterium]
MMEKKNVFNKIGAAFSNIVKYWSSPKPGNNVPYKETVAYSVGGIGVYFIQQMLGYMAFAGSSFVFANCYGIPPATLIILSVVSTAVGLLLAPLKSLLIDNMRSKYGKFRPFILIGGLPTVLFSLLIIFLPVDGEPALIYSAIFVTFTLVTFFNGLFSVAFNSLPQVMSSNSHERSWIYTISTNLFSFAPTICGVLLPFIAGVFKSETDPSGYENIMFYRLLFPIFGAIGVTVSLLCFFLTKERLVVSKEYVPHIKFLEGFEKVAKNKYFWLNNISAFFAPLRALVNATIMNFLLLYGSLGVFGMNRDATMSLFATVLGFAWTPGLLLAPVFIKKFGARKMKLASAFGCAAMSVAMLFCFLLPSPPFFLFIAIQMVWNFSASISMILDPTINADVLDYQQYKTGDRLDGYISQTGGMLTSIVGIATSAIPTALYAMFGAKDGNYKSLAEGSNTAFGNFVYLEIGDNLRGIIVAFCLVGAIGAALTAVPFFWYDLNGSKHRNMVKVLKIRAMFADNTLGVLSDTQLAETLNLINEERAVLNETVGQGTDKKSIKLYKDSLERKESAQITLGEVYKFESAEYVSKVEQASAIIAERDPVAASPPDFERYKTLTESHKNIASSGDKTQIKLLKGEIKALETAISVYNKTNKEYLAAVKLLSEKESYSQFDILTERFERL